MTIKINKEKPCMNTWVMLTVPTEQCASHVEAVNSDKIEIIIVMVWIVAYAQTDNMSCSDLSRKHAYF